MIKKNKVLIIAEIGPNHGGSIKKASYMVKKIAQTGVDVVKFQLGIPEKVYSKNAFKAQYQIKNDKSKSILEMSKKNQISKKNHLILNKLCKKLKLKYACSAFDFDSLVFLDKKLKVPFFKIPSGEINSPDMIDYISKSKKNIILSTGMATYEEIKFVLKKLKKNGNKNITILHCVSSYPVQKKNINLNIMDEIKRRFKCEVGYSDHSLGEEACLAAVSKGAKIIEKHVTISNSLNGPDHKASITIDKLKLLVNKIRDLEIILGSKEKKFTKDELNNKKVSRKSLVTLVNLKKNHVLKKSDITFKRPGIGISPIKLKTVLGKKIKRNIKENTIIKFSDIS